jgi:RNA polymerase sigma-70 factor (sigma-E family)
MDFDEFARERMPSLVRFATAVCADGGVAEDVVQEVLGRIYRDWPRIDALDAAEAYVRKAIVNEYLSWRRKWARIIPRHDLAHDPEPDVADAHAVRSELAHQLAALPPRQRAVLVMRYYADMTDAEIADAMGCRSVTVRGYASRGLSALRIALQEETATARSGHAYTQ